MKDLLTNKRYVSIALLFTFAGSAQSAETRVACDQSDNLDAKMTARYIHTPRRAIFDVSFKAPAATGLAARETLEVRVDGYIVGYAQLMPRAGDTLGATLSFDSYANTGYSDAPTVIPFPAGWPGVLPPQPVGINAGSRIMIGSLGCTLQ